MSAISVGYCFLYVAIVGSLDDVSEKLLTAYKSWCDRFLHTLRHTPDVERRVIHALCVGLLALE